MIERPSPNCDERPAGMQIDMLVLHYTGMATAESALERLCGPGSKVSAHYFVDEDGAISRLVREDQRAWHAGAAYWRGNDNINDRSIGIELVNPGHEFGYRAFPETQVTALILLCSGLLRRHSIPLRNVVGHCDVAPSRKQDPGELFDWQRLANAGIGLWPTPVAAEMSETTTMLAEFGYRANEQGALAAFQRHYRPSRFDGVNDDESTRLLAGLLAIAD